MIEQMIYGSFRAEDSPTGRNGFQIGAASPGIPQDSQWFGRAFAYYNKPHGPSFSVVEQPESAPFRVAFVSNGSGSYGVCAVCRGRDPVSARTNSPYAHVLFTPRQTDLGPLDVIRWYQAGAWQHPSDKPTKVLPTVDLESLDGVDEVDSDAGVSTGVREYVLGALLDPARRGPVVIRAPDSVVLAIVRTTLRNLPKSLHQTLSFSTFEAEPERWASYQLVGTWWDPDAGDRVPGHSPLERGFFFDPAGPRFGLSPAETLFASRDSPAAAHEFRSEFMKLWTGVDGPNDFVEMRMASQAYAAILKRTDLSTETLHAVLKQPEISSRARGSSIFVENLVHYLMSKRVTDQTMTALKSWAEDAWQGDQILTYLQDTIAAASGPVKSGKDAVALLTRLVRILDIDKLWPAVAAMLTSLSARPEGLESEWVAELYVIPGMWTDERLDAILPLMERLDSAAVDTMLRRAETPGQWIKLLAASGPQHIENQTEQIADRLKDPAWFVEFLDSDRIAQDRRQRVVESLLREARLPLATVAGVVSPRRDIVASVPLDVWWHYLQANADGLVQQAQLCAAVAPGFAVASPSEWPWIRERSWHGFYGAAGSRVATISTFLVPHLDGTAAQAMAATHWVSSLLCDRGWADIPVGDLDRGLAMVEEMIGPLSLEARDRFLQVLIGDLPASRRLVPLVLKYIHGVEVAHPASACDGWSRLVRDLVQAHASEDVLIEVLIARFSGDIVPQAKNKQFNKRPLREPEQEALAALMNRIGNRRLRRRAGRRSQNMSAIQAASERYLERKGVFSKRYVARTSENEAIGKKGERRKPQKKRASKRA